MKYYVYLSGDGDDERDGLTEENCVRTAAKAISIADTSGRNIRIVGDAKMQARLIEDLLAERKKLAD